MTVADPNRSQWRCSGWRRCAPLGLILLMTQRVLAFEVEMGTVTVQDTFSAPGWTSVSFIQPFAVTPMVAVLPSNQGGDPSTLRIRNVTTTGFEVLQVEPSANDGPHVQMNTAYIAAEPGSHVLPDGRRLIVLEHWTSSFANRLIATTWDSVAFPAAFGATPAVLAQIQTTANESLTPPSSPSAPFMDVGIRNVGSASLQVTLERAESTAGSVAAAERIGIIAIDSSVDLAFADVTGAPVVLKALRTASNIQGWDNGCFSNNYASPFAGTPLAVASANSRNGNNGGWLRSCSQSASSLGLTLDEDMDSDTERGHIGEIAGIISGSRAFHADFGVDLLVSKTYSLLADPYNGTSNPKSIPNADVQYTIGVVNRGAGSPDSDSLIVSEDIDPGIRICVSPACQAGGPVVLDASGSPIPPGVSLGLVEYSNDSGTTFGYVPIPDADGFDAAVDALRITLTGSLAGIAPGGAPSFALHLAARVN